MAERQYQYYEGKDGEKYRTFTEQRECILLYVDLKDNIYEVNVEDALGGGNEATLYIKKNNSGVNKDIIKVCEIMSEILDSRQKGSGIRLAGNYKETQIYVDAFLGGGEYKATKTVWSNLTISNGAVDKATLISKYARGVSNGSTKYVISSVKPYEKTTHITCTLVGGKETKGFNLNDNGVSKKIINMIEDIRDSSYGFSRIEDCNYILSYEKVTEYLKPKKRTVERWTVDAETLKKVDADVDKRDNNALNAMTEGKWNTYIKSESKGFTTAIPDFYHDYYPTLDADGATWIKGIVTETIDGDTFKLQAVDSKNFKLPIAGGGSVDIVVGEEYTIRLVGINTPETHKGGDLEQDAIKRNIEWLGNRNLPNDLAGKNLDMAFTIGKDASTFLKELILNKVVIVDIETKDNGWGIGVDKYRRILGVVHLPADIEDNQDSINVNRTMLSTLSKSYKDYTLADVSYYLDDGVLNSKFPVIGWILQDKDILTPERSIDDKDLEDEFKKFEESGFIDIHGKVWYNKNGNKKLSTKEIKKLDLNDLQNKDGKPYKVTTDYRANINPLIDESDTREWSPYDDMPTDFHVRIGDVTLVVPPLSINVVHTSKNEKVHTLRNRNAVQVQSGYSDYLITMELFFHDIDAINGYAIDNPFQIDSLLGGITKDQLDTLKELWPDPYYINGLRALLAQFSKAPFVPIYNEFLESTYGIYSVGLESIQISTVPGFPNTLAVTLTMVNFDHTAYMPDTLDLGEVIDWPIFRWYLQDALQKRKINSKTYDSTGNLTEKEELDPHHIYYDKINGGFSNELSFEIADENILKMKLNAIKSLRNRFSPAVFKNKNSGADTTIGQFESDYKSVNYALKQWKKFAAWKASHNKHNYPDFYNDEGIFSGSKEPSWNSEGWSLFLNSRAGIINKGEELVDRYTDDLLSAVYGDNWYKNYRGKTGWKGTAGERGAYFIMNGNHVEVGFHPLSSSKTMWDWPLYTEQDNKSGGWIVVPIRAEVNKNLVQSSGVLHYTQNNGGEEYVIAVIDPNDTTLLNAILKNGKEGGEDSYKAYEEETNRIQSIADVTENSVPMIPVEIDGLHVISISASATNVFSKLQLQELGAPTLQYLGGQEMYFTIKAQTKDRETVKQLKSMVEESQRLARDYRIAINSGFLDINNSLINFLGVHSILIEQLVVATVPGTPELIDITISCTSFDKTQRERESLKQIQLRNPSSEQYTMEEFEKYFSKNSNNEEQQWAIFDFKLRQLELYPDLDLPTWTEFGIAIPYLKCGVKSLKELNDRIKDITGSLPPDRAKYVDPDFYIHCGWTNRLIINDALKDKEAKALCMHDGGGVKMVEYAPGPTITELTNPSAQVNEKFWTEDKALKEQLKEDLDEASEYLDKESQVIIKDIDTGYGTIYNDSASPEQSGDLPYVNMAAVNVYSYDAKKAKDRDKFIFKYLHEVPTAAEVAGWEMGDTSNYAATTRKIAELEKQLKKPETYFKNPTQAQVIKEIEANVDLFWKFPDAIDASAKQTQSDTEYGKGGTISVPRITKRKIVNVIKTIVHQESTYRQFYAGKMTINGVKYNQVMPLFPLNKGNIYETDDGWVACGIMQMAVGTAGNVRNLNEARRAAWDWKFNLKIGMARFAAVYNGQATNGSPEAKALPLDYAVVKYNRPANNDLNGKYYKDFLNIFHTCYAGANQTAADSETVRNAAVAKEENDALIDNITIDTNVIFDGTIILPSQHDATFGLKRYLMFYPNLEKYIKDKGKDGKIVLKTVGLLETVWEYHGRDDEWTSTMEDATRKVLDLVETKLKNGDEFNHKTDAIGVAASKTKDGKINWDINIVSGQGQSLNETVNDLAIYQEMKSATILPNKDTVTVEAYQGSFVDSMEFDMRGRLVRAYPTFQMFIIDEGRWSFWYKLWDNLYGYNAIQSIDLIKDREIVADTLIMQMTNVYTNLTTKESQFDDDDSSFTILDLFSGSQNEKKKVWNTIWDVADDEIIEARAEHLDTMMLKAGARIHLRMGYGSNADNMPVVFNGTITEMDAQEIVTVIAQSDGIELTNKIHAKNKDTNASLFDWHISEPRQLICSLMSSRGGMWKDWLNLGSKGLFFKGNPLGIAHFGGDALVPPALKNIPIFQSSDDDWGEVGFNIYSASGEETYSQWICYGKKDQLLSEPDTLSWGITPSEINTSADEDIKEPKIKVYLYDKTVWDVINVLSMAVPDYICAVHPFELRSTLFYGKPMWGLAYQYDYLFRVNPEDGQLERIITHEYRKPYSQFHVFNGFSDILNNKIKATESGMYTNVIVAYGGNKNVTTPIIQADSDIYIENQKTAIVQADIATDERFGIGTGILSTNFWTSEMYAQTVGSNTLRNYMAHMYDGELVILGYPSIKPHDKFYLEDNYSDMQGLAGVRRVVHHMSFETGFVTSITPDCICVVDDMQQLSLAGWLAATGSGVAVGALTKIAGIRTLNRLFRGLVGRSWRTWKRDSKELGKPLGGLIAKLIDPEDAANIGLTDDLMDALRSGRKFTNAKKAILDSKTDSKVINGIKNVLTAIDKIDDTSDSLKDIGKAAKAVRLIKGLASVADIALGVTGSIIIDVGVTYVSNGIVETYRRYRHNRQAVVLMPLKYRGKPYTAGINGHKGLIYGEPGGRLDKWFDSSFVQIIDGILFDEDKNPSLKNKMTAPEDYLND